GTQPTAPPGPLRSPLLQARQEQHGARLTSSRRLYSALVRRCPLLPPNTAASNVTRAAAANAIRPPLVSVWSAIGTDGSFIRSSTSYFEPASVARPATIAVTTTPISQTPNPCRVPVER